MSRGQAHASYVLARLRADTGPPVLVVFDGGVPKGLQPTPPYVVVYFRIRTPSGFEVPEKVSKENTSDVIDTSAYCHSVGVDAEAARSVADRLAARLLGVTPAIAGRVCGPICHDDAVPADRDETTGVVVYDQVDVYRFISLPA